MKTRKIELRFATYDKTKWLTIGSNGTYDVDSVKIMLKRQSYYFFITVNRLTWKASKTKITDIDYYDSVNLRDVLEILLS